MSNWSVSQCGDGEKRSGEQSERIKLALSLLHDVSRSGDTFSFITGPRFNQGHARARITRQFLLERSSSVQRVRIRPILRNSFVQLRGNFCADETWSSTSRDPSRPRLASRVDGCRSERFYRSCRLRLRRLNTWRLFAKQITELLPRSVAS